MCFRCGKGITSMNWLTCLKRCVGVNQVFSFRDVLTFNVGFCGHEQKKRKCIHSFWRPISSGGREVVPREQPVKGYFVPLLSGCPTAWDDIGCWSRAEVGQVVSLSCANVSQLFANTQGKWLRSTGRFSLPYSAHQAVSESEVIHGSLAGATQTDPQSCSIGAVKGRRGADFIEN